MDDLHHIRQHWSVLESLANDRQWFDLRSPDVSAWSVGEQLAHIVLSLNAMVIQVSRALRKPSGPPGDGPNRMGRMILDSGVFPRGRAQAPEVVRPKKDGNALAVQKMLSRTKSKWDDIESRAEEIVSSQAFVKHDLLGDFTASDWIRFAFTHTNHHLRIVRDIIVSAGSAVPKFLGPVQPS